MRTLVTGAAGFLGAAVATALAERGDTVAVLLHTDTPAPRLNRVAHQLTRIVGDLFAPDTYTAAVNDFAPQALVHCGWWGVGGAARNHRRQLQNLPATAALLDAAIGAGATTLLGIGSQAEYGPAPAATSETSPTRPTTLYGIAKLAAGQTLLNIAAERSARGVWGRIYSLYGPGDDPSWLIPSLIRSLCAGTSLDLTACEQIWEYLHVHDAAAAILALLDCDTAAGVFNIGAGTAIPLRQIVEMLGELAGSATTPAFGKRPYRPDQVMHLQADISRLITTTGWHPTIALADGLRQLVLQDQTGPVTFPRSERDPHERQGSVCRVGLPA